MRAAEGTNTPNEKTIKSTYVIHHGGEFDAVADVHLQDVQHSDQFIRRELSKESIKRCHRSSRPAVRVAVSKPER